MTSFIERFAADVRIDPQTTYLITTSANRRYAADFPSSDGIIALRGDRAVLLLDGRYYEQAAATVTAMEVRLLSVPDSDLVACVGELGGQTVCTETAVTVAELTRRKKQLPDYTVEPSAALSAVLSDLRSVKQPDEIARIEAAQAVTEAAFTHILGWLAPGRTELDVALELEFFMRKNGAHGVAFDTIAVSGENSSKPHGVPTGRALQKGDLLTMDFGAQVAGYHSDMTRTVAIGPPSDEARAVYALVLAANEAALNVCRPGIPACEVDAAARTVIEQAGYGDRFLHSTGHGVGVEVHEAPGLHRNNKAPLRFGNVITVEPGVYLEGCFGVRIEDMAAITETGAKNLTSADKQLIIL